MEQTNKEKINDYRQIKLLSGSEDVFKQVNLSNFTLKTEQPGDSCDLADY